MKSALRTLFSPILKHFENGTEEFAYVASHRWITIAVGFLFFVVTACSIALLVYTKSGGAVLPMLAFGTLAVVSLVIGFLGSDRAIAKIWNTKVK